MDAGRTLYILVSLKTNYNNLGAVEEMITCFILIEALYYHMLF